MEKEVIVRNTQVVLFFDKTIEYNTIKLANSINEKLPKLGQPNIFNIPNDVPTEIRMQAPRIIFNSARDINITITTSKLDMFFNSASNKEVYVKGIYDALLENGLNIQAIGVVNTYISNDIKIEKLKGYFNDEEIKQGDLINFSWYKKSENFNIWKNIETQNNNEIIDLIYTIDINNLGNNKVMSVDEIIEVLEKSINIAKQAAEKISKELGE